MEQALSCILQHGDWLNMREWLMVDATKTLRRNKLLGLCFLV